MNNKILYSLNIFVNIFFYAGKIDLVIGSVVENDNDADNSDIIDISKYYLNEKGIKNIPDEIYKGKKQTMLNLSRRNITLVQSNISLLDNLVFIDLSENSLENLCKLPKSLKRIDLHINNFDSFPTELEVLKNLKVIDLDYNKITELPTTIVCLNKLEVFSISNNKLKKLPYNFDNFKVLKKLDFSYNYLLDMETFCKIESLEKLYLNCNYIAEIPKLVCNLKNLQSLDMSRNEIKNLPKELSKCTKLDFLILDSNFLTEFEEACNIKSLNILNINYNQILNIPQKIYYLKNLVDLSLNKNKISNLPSNLSECELLKILNLKNNRIKTLPLSLFKFLSNLEVLDLRGNPIKYPASDTEIDILELKLKMGDRLKICNIDF